MRRSGVMCLNCSKKLALLECHQFLIAVIALCHTWETGIGDGLQKLIIVMIFSVKSELHTCSLWKKSMTRSSVLALYMIKLGAILKLSTVSARPS